MRLAKLTKTVQPTVDLLVSARRALQKSNREYAVLDISQLGRTPEQFANTALFTGFVVDIVDPTHAKLYNPTYNPEKPTLGETVTQTNQQEPAMRLTEMITGNATLQPTKPNWATTSSPNIKILAAKLATILGEPPPRLSNGEGYLERNPVFIGFIPKDAGPARPNARFVFEVNFRGQWLLAAGNDLDAIAAKLATVPAPAPHNPKQPTLGEATTDTQIAITFKDGTTINVHPYYGFAATTAAGPTTIMAHALKPGVVLTDPKWQPHGPITSIRPTPGTTP